jgi:hypothetical protein
LRHTEDVWRKQEPSLVTPGDEGRLLLAPHVFGVPGRVTLGGTVATGSGDRIEASLWTDIDRRVGYGDHDRLREVDTLSALLDGTYDLGVLHDRRYPDDSRRCSTLLSAEYNPTEGAFSTASGATGSEFALDAATVSLRARPDEGTPTGVDVVASEPFHEVSVRGRGPSTFDAPEPATYRFPRGTTVARGLFTNALSNNERAPLAGVSIDSCVLDDRACAPVAATRPVGLRWRLPSDATATDVRFQLALTARQCHAE